MRYSINTVRSERERESYKRPIHADWSDSIFSTAFCTHFFQTFTFSSSQQQTIDMHSFVVARESIIILNIHCSELIYLFILSIASFGLFYYYFDFDSANSIGMWRRCEILGPTTTTTTWCLLKSLRTIYRKSVEDKKKINAKRQQRKAEFQCAHSAECLGLDACVWYNLVSEDRTHTRGGGHFNFVKLLFVFFIFFMFLSYTYFRIKLALECERAAAAAADRFVCVISDFRLVVCWVLSGAGLCLAHK